MIPGEDQNGNGQIKAKDDTNHAGNGASVPTQSPQDIVPCRGRRRNGTLST